MTKDENRTREEGRHRPVTEGKKIPMRTMKEVVMSQMMSPFSRSPCSLFPTRSPSLLKCSPMFSAAQAETTLHDSPVCSYVFLSVSLHYSVFLHVLLCSFVLSVFISVPFVLCVPFCSFLLLCVPLHSSAFLSVSLFRMSHRM